MVTMDANVYQQYGKPKLIKAVQTVRKLVFSLVRLKTVFGCINSWATNNYLFSPRIHHFRENHCRGKLVYTRPIQTCKKIEMCRKKRTLTFTIMYSPFKWSLFHSDRLPNVSIGGCLVVWIHLSFVTIPLY